MNIKMFLTVTLLGVSLYLGGSSVIYAESAENVTENFEDKLLQIAILSQKWKRMRHGLLWPEQLRLGFFQQMSLIMILKRSQKKLCLHLYLLIMNSRFWRLFQKALQCDLDVAGGSDITETLNTVLHFMGRELQMKLLVR